MQKTFYIIMILSSLIFSETLETKYQVEIKECVIKKQVFSFDTFNCVDANLTIDRELQLLIDSIDLTIKE